MEGTASPTVIEAVDSFVADPFERIPSFVAAPDLSDNKPPLEQKMATEHQVR